MKDYDEGVVLYSQKRYPEAIQCFEDALSIRKVSSEIKIHASYCIAISYYHLRNYEKALESIQRCETYKVPFHLLHSVKMTCLTRLGLFAESATFASNIEHNAEFRNFDRFLAAKAENAKTQATIWKLESFLNQEKYNLAEKYCDRLDCLGYVGAENYFYKFECIIELRGREQAQKYSTENNLRKKSLLYTADKLTNLNLMAALSKFHISFSDHSLELDQLMEKIEQLFDSTASVRVTKALCNLKSRNKKAKAELDELVRQVQLETSFLLKKASYLKIIALCEEMGTKAMGHQYRLILAKLYFSERMYDEAINLVNPVIADGNDINGLRMRRDCFIKQNNKVCAKKDAESVYEKSRDAADEKVLYELSTHEAPRNTGCSNGIPSTGFGSKRPASQAFKSNPPPTKVQDVRRYLPSTCRIHCEALGISQCTSLNEVKSSYKKKCLRYHPDKNVGKSPQELEENHKKMLDLSKAYNQLSEIFKKGF